MSRALPTDLEEMAKKLVYLIKVRDVSRSCKQAADHKNKIDLLTLQYELAKSNSEFCANKYEMIYQMNRRNINAASAQQADHAHLTCHREKFYKDYFKKQKETLDSEVSLVEAAKRKNSLSASGKGSSPHSFFIRPNREDLQKSDARLQLLLKVAAVDQGEARLKGSGGPAARPQTGGGSAEHACGLFEQETDTAPGWTGAFCACLPTPPAAVCAVWKSPPPVGLKIDTDCEE